ncbi:hypothetical protein ACHHYP_20159 [Achlya hypogyna]|uniref:Uncharacterized protein n=1 Tax=Achlya hypogyna TaxID=1202772 RepID=A0A1V9Z1S7_ACHHY|nr:hypothetical protein ACHHYP_20159 [Achlya hypogyna]
MGEVEELLYNAARYGNDNEVAYLVRAGADLHWRSNAGWTAVHLACYMGHEAVVQSLANAGADLNLPDDSNTSTPLITASSRGFDAIVDILLKAGANLNQNNNATSYL